MRLAWKLRSIALSGAIAGAVGAFYAVVLLVVTPPSVFGMLVSAQALTVSMFGGVGTVWGPLIGAAVLIPVGEILNAELGARLPGIQGVIYGIAIIVVILVAPEGIFWTLRDRFRPRKPSPAAIPPEVSASAAQLVPAEARPAGRRVPSGEVLLSVQGAVEVVRRSQGGAERQLRRAPGHDPSESSGPTAPARRPCSTCSTVSCRRTPAR